MKAMANPFDGEDVQILEGFLCPICREDLKTPERLTEHVEQVHAEEQDVLKSLREIFTKATRKILLNFDETVDLAKSIDSDLKLSNAPLHMSVIYGMIQDVGVDYSHLSYFNAVRTPRLERYASETNKLIIRLHKLLKDRPTDPVQRKIHEQKTVPWLDGSSVKLCPNCARSFHLTRRQHHCRLCGSIMCQDCSKFLPLEDAITLVSLNTTVEEQNASRDQNANNIRTCEHCLHLLEARKEMHDSRTSRPPVTVYYNQIQEMRKEIIPDIEMYIKIVNSLYDGDSIFTISDASALRGKIGRTAENIDYLSKKILSLPTLEGSREEAVKKAIRHACIQFIKEEMLSIPQIPVEDEIKKIQAKKKQETEQKIETERRLAMEAYEKYGIQESNPSSATSSNKDSYASGSSVTTLDNWSGRQNLSSHSSDPLIEQINIIKGYIKQAREAMRFDEVATLQINLRELQNELYERNQQKENYN